MDAHTLNAWTRFALQKGGIGSCTALLDNPASEAEDLMFMTGEKIIVLRRLEEESESAGKRRNSGINDPDAWYLGYCEGVVGRFRGVHVEFHGKLKKPVLMRRSGAGSIRESSMRPMSKSDAATMHASQVPPGIPVTAVHSDGEESEMSHRRSGYSSSGSQSQRQRSNSTANKPRGAVSGVTTPPLSDENHVAKVRARLDSADDSDDSASALPWARNSVSSSAESTSGTRSREGRSDASRSQTHKLNVNSNSTAAANLPPSPISSAESPLTRLGPSADTQNSNDSSNSSRTASMASESDDDDPTPGNRRAEYTFSIYDVYGRDSVAFPNFPMLKGDLPASQLNSRVAPKEVNDAARKTSPPSNNSTPEPNQAKEQRRPQGGSDSSNSVPPNLRSPSARRPNAAPDPRGAPPAPNLASKLRKNAEENVLPPQQPPQQRGQFQGPGPQQPQQRIPGQGPSFDPLRRPSAVPPPQGGPRGPPQRQMTAPVGSPSMGPQGFRGPPSSPGSSPAMSAQGFRGSNGPGPNGPPGFNGPPAGFNGPPNGMRGPGFPGPNGPMMNGPPGPNGRPMGPGPNGMMGGPGPNSMMGGPGPGGPGGPPGQMRAPRPFMTDATKRRSQSLSNIRLDFDPNRPAMPYAAGPPGSPRAPFGPGGPGAPGSERNGSRELRKMPSNPQSGPHGGMGSLTVAYPARSPSPMTSGDSPGRLSPGARSDVGPSSKSPTPSANSSSAGGRPSAEPARLISSPPAVPPEGVPVTFDQLGFIVGPGPAFPPQPEDPSAREKWHQIIAENDLAAARKSRKVKKLVQAGIPSVYRGKVWLFLANAWVRRRPGLFEKLVKDSMDKKGRKGRETAYDAIEKDLDRCYPDHKLFRGEGSTGKADLEAILKAYVHYNPVVGYTQGMGLIAGMLLIHMPAEDAFWLLCALLREPHMEGYYANNLKQMHVDGVVFGNLLEIFDPELHARLTSLGVDMSNFTPNWLLPLFVRIVPWATLTRIWDVLFFEGPVWILRVALAIIRIIRDPLMDPRRCPTLAEAMQLLLHPPQANLTPANVLACAFSVKLKEGEIRKLSRNASKLVRQKQGLGRGRPQEGDGDAPPRSASAPPRR